MEHFEASVVIDRPIEEVFAFVTDLDKTATWASGVVEARVTSPGEVRLGSTYVFIRQVFGRRVETNGEVTAYEPHTEYAWKATSGPFPLAGGNRLGEVDGGTRVTSWMEAEPGGFFALARPVLRRMVRRQLESDTNNLKDVLEHRGE